MRPQSTRLRYIIAKNPIDIVDFLNQLPVRVQIYGQPVWTGSKWVLWFVPNDDGADISPIDLTK